jgi:hypothetical protein
MVVIDFEEQSEILAHHEQKTPQISPGSGIRGKRPSTK